MTLYQRAMRRASAILFGLSLIIVLGTMINGVLVFYGRASQLYQYLPLGFPKAQLVMLLVQAFQNAALPFFGAAVLWRVDRWLKHIDGEAAE